MRSVIRYPGSKARLADWIIGHFPEHRSYLEPFLGSGAVLFQKPRSSIETVNDLDGEVINLFDCIRRDPERLACRWQRHLRGSRSAFQNLPIPLWLEKMKILTA